VWNTYTFLRIPGNTPEKITSLKNGLLLRDMTPEALEIKTKINKWDYIKLKSSAPE
jgi:hypothetical protein